MTSRTFDAVVVGAGINGMVAAAELAGAGWSVALVDEREKLGGFIASDSLTRPGFVHDTFSSWHPLFVTGGAYATLGDDLHRHGLAYSNTDGAVTAAVSDHGVAVAHRDPTKTAHSFEYEHDRAAYAAMLAELESWSPHVFGALGSELRPFDLARLGVSMARALGKDGSIDMLRISAQSGRALIRERFRGFEADHLWSPWLLHAGLSPDHATGGLMLPIMAFTMHAVGLPVVTGGADNFVTAFARVLSERGVTVILGETAAHIEIRSGRAVAVHLADERLSATRAVLSSTATPRLYDNLLDPAAVPAAGRRAADRHRPGRAAMQLHFALDRPVRWSDSRLDDVPLVHIGNGASSTGIACAQAESGYLPADPTIVVGQQCVLDPSRAPTGKATLWVQLQELPFAPKGDAAGSITTDGTWSPDTTAAYVDRVLDSIERFAPGLRATVLDSYSIPPTALTAANANAVAGDPYGGAAEIDQSLFWRPGTGTGHRTGIDGLFHIGAFTHPGPGLGGGSGHLVAQQLLAPSRRTRTADRIRIGIEKFTSKK
ncbi:NAD(P)/FAD-dependent oxidoreductase [Rhodococcoides fascians A21d2]|uniref:phytoene desaturase family protein n=1 Tax=Rhodococcoides fascians TaxID=1828 RepID=UPI00056BA02B|nr:NAD(P)/FAD-dependent oxidoreductase [Rhodococcus fascians]QII00295.1 NAD(P)/FAD-dependent oxidoreductase [Rhodococcus fascians A21d2]